MREVLDTVGLDPDVYGRRRPRQLSGGQAQRVAIARALTLDPALIICDEAVSSLDVLIQAQVLNLFERLRAELGLSYLFIAHDLALVKQVSDRVAVMYLGSLCELGPAEALYREPLHPYTVALLASIPSPDPEAPRTAAHEAISGDPPSPIDPPSGCRFRTRCPRAQERCAAEVPEMRDARPRPRRRLPLPRRAQRRPGVVTATLPDYRTDDPAIKSLPRDELRALQDERLRALVAYARATSGFWRDRLARARFAASTTWPRWRSPRAPSSAPSRPSTRPSATTRAARARRGWGSSRRRAPRGASSSASSPGATGGS